jgi:hypothetical protein
VADRTRKYAPGWASYADDFKDLPELEYFAGGINEKTPTAAALWRQGNLLHFGFEQSPAEMNEAGQALLLNAIAYISRFTEDRPIAVTPSVFSGPVPRLRSSVARALSNRSAIDNLDYYLGPQAMIELRDKTPAACLDWFNRNRDFLYPTVQGALDVDADAKAIGTPPAQIEFFARAFEALRRSGTEAKRAAALLARYAPDGPGGDAVETWQRWFDENKAYLFFCEAGGYRWYVDPLAKKRHVPTSDLRGPARATLP